MRAAVEVRAAGQDDLVAVAALAAEAVDEAPTAVQAGQGDSARLAEHLSVLIGAGGSVLVATLDDTVCGFLVVRLIEPQLFAPTASAYVDAVYVPGRARRRGVGHALVAAMATLAAERGAEQVFCAPAPGARGMHRFLARLGFAPASGHRVVGIATLQRRLAQEGPQAPRGARVSRRDATRAAIEDLVARRRRARAAGLPTGPVDLRDFQAQREAMLRDAADAAPAQDVVADARP
ncbi:GNAT family N-acetyltransferase [Isoptericola sp. NEAU-Y5]|uniref:GNAT family N-acetyltransferase n=1 Tax=Isoptericola luteus TaxID=2879484 RepID=A0ABS7ZID2_9MICO|nr:GNAT family N-acetyltransferase [Isoptericola sp. NEAU-Y5]MCA5893555.1 GNAT family N-acetyltransferase [Isoptericola sp. NEAU-Y5]